VPGRPVIWRPKGAGALAEGDRDDGGAELA
jgi:hypothetical protein